MRKIRISLVAFAIVALVAVLPGQSRISEGADAKRFVGTWRLVETRTNGNPDPVRGLHPNGLIYYDATGHMAAQIMPEGGRRAYAGTLPLRRKRKQHCAATPPTLEPIASTSMLAPSPIIAKATSTRERSGISSGDMNSSRVTGWHCGRWRIRTSSFGNASNDEAGHRPVLFTFAAFTCLVSAALTQSPSMLAATTYSSRSSPGWKSVTRLPRARPPSSFRPAAPNRTVRTWPSASTTTW